VSNNAELHGGDLLLVDAGCELGGYASDITRTWPVSGRFNAAQRDVYQLVLDSQTAAFAEVKPGARFIDYHDAAVKVLAQGMLDLGLLQGSLDEVIDKGDYRRFYMHRTGHWLGMDVHDAGEYRPRGGGPNEWRTLEAGMVLTVEPGCYIRPADDVPEAFWNIGIRIEDDVIVTADGCDIYTAAAPKTVADIEAVMAEARG
jgi:Xaa-Pro aminopeptidase